MNIPDSFVVLDVPGLIKFDPELRVSIIEMATVLGRFLQENGLVTHSILDDGKRADQDFKLKMADLTPEGFEVIRLGLDKWMKTTIDRRADPSDTKILERALHRVRSSK